MKSKPKSLVCICIPCLGIGGTEMQTLSMSRILQSCGLNVFVLCYFEYKESIVAEFQRSGVEVRLLGLKRNLNVLRFVLRLRNEIKTIRPDIVHVQYMAPGALPIIAARIAGIKNVFATVHQPFTSSHKRYTRFILKVASCFTSGFIAVSRNAEKSWFGSSSIYDENKPRSMQAKHFTIYNAIDSDEIQHIAGTVDPDNLKAIHSIPSHIPLIGTVSRLCYEKGVDLLVKAFSHLIKDRTDATLLIVGSGPENEKLKYLVECNGISDRVIFTGAIDWLKAIELVSIMDIFVVPSRFEGFGLTAAEAMAVGKPVIASDCFGLKEIVINEETGIVFPVENILALKNALAKLINDQDLKYRLGKAGKERVISDFSLDIFKKKIRALYGI